MENLFLGAQYKLLWPAYSSSHLLKPLCSPAPPFNTLSNTISVMSVVTDAYPVVYPGEYLALLPYPFHVGTWKGMDVFCPRVGSYHQIYKNIRTADPHSSPE